MTKKEKNKNKTQKAQKKTLLSVVFLKGLSTQRVIKFIWNFTESSAHSVVNEIAPEGCGI